MDQTNKISFCLNCGSKLMDVYCHKCGQKNLRKKLTLKDVLNDIVKYVFELEGPFIKTIKYLTIKPGKVCKEFVNGKRKIYVQPVQYFIIALTLYYLIVFLSGIDFNKIIYQHNKQLGMPLSEKEFEEYTGLLSSNLKLFTFILIPIFAVISKLFFKRSGYNYAENIVMAFYLHAHTLLIGILLFPLIIWKPTMLMLSAIPELFYIIFGLVQFNHGKLFLKIIKSFLVYFVSYLIFIIIVNIINSLYLFFVV